MARPASSPADRDSDLGLSYSSRSAVTGSIRTARLAGIIVAAPATTTITSGTIANVIGSRDSIPKTSAVMNLANPSATASPTAMPIPLVEAL